MDAIIDNMSNTQFALATLGAAVLGAGLLAGLAAVAFALIGAL